MVRWNSTIHTSLGPMSQFGLTFITFVSYFRWHKEAVVGEAWRGTTQDGGISYPLNNYYNVWHYLIWKSYESVGVIVITFCSQTRDPELAGKVFGRVSLHGVVSVRLSKNRWVVTLQPSNIGILTILCVYIHTHVCIHTYKDVQRSTKEEQAATVLLDLARLSV